MRLPSPSRVPFFAAAAVLLTACDRDTAPAAPASPTPVASAAPAAAPTPPAPTTSTAPGSPTTAPKAPPTMLKVGDPAPAFRVLDHTGKERTLADFQGKRVVLWFFPKALTGG